MSALLGALVLGLAVPCAYARIVYVNGGQTNSPAPDGATWATAFATVQAAINAAADGDEVWVAAAAYPENVSLKDGVALYGGFQGNETDRVDRDWTFYLTILDGNQSGSVVSVTPGATSATRIDGFVIRNGRAAQGAGIFCTNASPVIANNDITSNTATGNLTMTGAGIYLYGGTPLITNNIIRGNQNAHTGATDWNGGGGIASEHSEPVIVHNRILRNTALGGAGIRCNYGSGLIAHNVIIANRAVWHAGGVECLSASPAIRQNWLIGNSAFQGGGISCIGGKLSAPIENNLLIANSDAPIVPGMVGGSGGGIYCSRVESAIFINNSLLWNDATLGGGIWSDSAKAIVVNNLIAFGSSGIDGEPGLSFSNNCIFGNGAKNFGGLPDPTGTNGNISVNPLLTGSASFPGFHLLASSPCRDAGNGDFTQPGDEDLEGNPRILGSAVDIGAIEFSGPFEEPAPRIICVSTTGDDRNDGSSWAKAKRTVQAALDAANLGDEVWVQAGVYQELITLMPFVSLFGGFAGTETVRAQRNPKRNLTVLDGNQQGSVVTALGLLQWGTIDGFEIRNGKADRGGGIYCAKSSLLIANNRIVANTATNVANTGGGGIYCSSVSPVISNNWIILNQANGGGGIYCNAQALVANNVVVSNAAFGSGGGVAVFNARSTIINNLITDNKALGASPTTLGMGGGIWGNMRDGARIVNNTVVRNQSLTGTGTPGSNVGAGIYAAGRPIDLTIANNIVAFGSSGVYIYSLTDLRNNCVFGNATNDYSGIANPTGANGNISADPRFVDPEGDFRLRPGSPCIDAGDDSDVPAGWLDLDGFPRIAGPHVDIGAYEFRALTSLKLDLLSAPPDGPLRLRLTGEPGRRYVLEFSSDLLNWLPLATNQTTTMPLDMIDEGAGGFIQRFYRARQAP